MNEEETGYRPIPWSVGSFRQFPDDLPVDTSGTAGPDCDGMWAGWWCTRLRDHPGNCWATISNRRIIAEWSDPARGTGMALGLFYWTTGMYPEVVYRLIDNQETVVHCGPPVIFPLPT